MNPNELSAWDSARKDVFVINDINLIVPPSQISIQREDLVWSWKTLRTKTSTKIPSGQGQIQVKLSIVFTNAMLLDLHRLIVEFRQSPFCYVDNRYLRESIVPEWPIHQNLAFTMTSLNIAPLGGSSDSWVAEIDLTWFNYFPYGANFVYRKDWRTEWLDNYANTEGLRYKTSIGWDVVNGKKIHRPSIVAQDDGQGRSSWSVVSGGIQSTARRTIFELEELHKGEVFDTQPLPGNMEPAQMVMQPRESNIYVRYINYLQRDALKESFNIDIEADLRSIYMDQYFFGVVGVVESSPERQVTIPLHDLSLLETLEPADKDAVEQLQKRWLSQMLQHNRGVTFHWSTYKSIKLPPKFMERMQRSQQTLLQKLMAEDAIPSPSTIIHHGTQDARVGGTEVRQGYSNPDGKFTPIGHPLSTVPMSVADLEAIITSRVSWRDQQTLDRAYSDGRHREARMHKGTDFGTNRTTGWPLFAVASGRVLSVSRRANAFVWKAVRYDGSGERVLTSITDAFEFALNQTRLPWTSRSDNGKVRVGNAQLDQLGVAIKYGGMIYFTDFANDGGLSIEILHDDGSLSKYRHVSDQAVVSAGEPVIAGRLIGYSSNTSQLAYEFSDLGTGFLSSNWQPIPGALNAYKASQVSFSLRPHLHFEFYEPREVSEDTYRTQNNANDLVASRVADPMTGQEQRDHIDRVLVDPVPSYQQARTKSLNYIDAPEVENIVDIAASATQRAYENGELSLDEVAAFMTFVSGLTAEGWYYYEGDDKIINVWEQPKSLSIQDTPLDVVNEYTEDTVVLTNLSGGLRHIVANIPILGHEYPTQQHLGSTEPVYAFEFAVVDDKFDINGAIKDLEGISQKAQMLQWLRSSLQTNARAFRGVVDGWCVATDSFITRLLGSYKYDDYTVTYSNGGVEDTRVLDETFEDKIINSFKLKKRTVISRESSGTVEGNPGLSSIFFELEETNPYADEKLTPVLPSVQDMEEVKKQILHAVYNFNLQDIANGADLTRDEILTLLIAQRNNVNTNTNSDRFGVFRVLDDRLTFWQQNDLVVRNGSNFQYYFVDTEGSFIKTLEDIGVQTNTGPNTNGGWGSAVRTYIDLPSSLISKASSIHATTVTEFNIRGLLEAHPQFVDMPIEFLINHLKLLKATINMAETILVEHQDMLDSGIYTGDPGLRLLEVQEQLYDLPVDPSMWRKWQWYQYAYIGYSHPVNERQAAINSLVVSPGWLRFKDDLILGPNNNHAVIADSIAKTLSNETILWTIWNVSTAGSNAISNLSNSIGLLDQAVQGVSGNTTPLFQGMKSAQQDRAVGAIGLLVDQYMTFAAGVYGVESELKQYGIDYVFGDTLNSLFSGRSQVDELNSMHGPLQDELLSGGMWDADGYGLPRYIGLNSSTTIGLYISDIINFNPALIAADATDTAARPTNSVHIWKVRNSQENAKLRYIKSILSELAQSVLSKPDAMRALGLSELASKVDVGVLAGSAAYPDLDLPTHPYYGDDISVDPDFYMWNIYEDGQAFSADVMAELESSLDEIIDRSYQSIRTLEAGERPLSRQTLLLEDDPTAPLPISQRIQAEGSITPPTNNGPMASPFYPSNVTEQHIATWRAGYEANAQSTAKNFQAEMAAAGSSSSVFSRTAQRITTLASLPSNIRNTITTTTADQITDNRSLGIRLGSGEGAFGQGGGLHAPMRVAPEQYERLKENWTNMTSMFGSREGYLARHGTLNSLAAQTPEQRNNLERLDSPGHFFDPDALKKLARESSIDLRSQRVSMKQAYPTFKLYFIEEDENEDRLLNFDDFYSYNAVKEFMVTSSRKLPADHAIIVLQNVAGTLDGTKRRVVTDLDYFGRDVREKTTFQNSIPIESVVEDTTGDQPFGALVLRPGMNIQLRAGYCVDEKTEILSQRGWLTHDQLNINDIVLTLNVETNLSEWQRVQRVNRFWSENEDLFSIEGQSHSSLTTANHRWPVQYEKMRNGVRAPERRWKTSDTLGANDWIIGAAKHNNFPTEKKWKDSFVEIMAWFWTEGNIRNKGLNRNPIITISQSRIANPDKVTQIENALRNLFGDPVNLLSCGSNHGHITEPKWRRYDRPDRDEVEFKLNSIASKDLLIHAPNKEVALAWIQELTEDQINLFIQTSNRADGHYSQKDDGPLIISQKNPKSLNALELACILSGYRTRLYQVNYEVGTGEKAYKPTVLYASRIPCIKIDKRYHYPTKKKYTGINWCPTTQNGTWLARRNGLVHFTGNSNDPRNLHVLISGRVVDLTWNKSGDLTEIMVQSFGTELVQELKGIDKNNGDTFYTTHQLLGSLMLEPEVTHFGRWEFGQLFQTGESKDARLDFYEYSREGYLGKFTAFNSVTRFIMNHWALFGAALIGGTIVSLLPGSGRFGAGIAKVFGRRSIDDIAGKAIGREGFERMFTTGIGVAEKAVVRRALLSQSDVLAKQAFRAATDAEKQSLRATWLQLLRKINSATNVDDAVKASLEAESFIRSRPIYGYLTGSFTTTWTDLGLGTLPSIGWTSAKTVGRTFFWDAGTALTKIGIGLIAIDLYSEIVLRPLALRRVKAVRDFFKSRQAHLFLSPQDDNLYPPHPKDYMDLGANYFFELSMAFTSAIGRGLGLPEELHEFVWDSSFFTQVNEALLKKTVHPDQAQYQLAGSTIWDVFHEMSLRHPGWIYGARPYGNRFRYTMFFGVPSQRYWAKPASNEFVDRMNDLHRVLSDDRVTLAEYEYLNNNRYPGGVDKDTYLAEMRRAFTQGGFAETSVLSPDIDLYVERQLKAQLMKEYLRGLELRFIPFRRYHLISSSNNLVWNGIMSSENAVSNAVDVTYYPPDSMASESGMPSGTALYKASSRIPDTRLRIAPIRYPNCKGYTMANRYGMGELLHRMREMYRGEIIIRGNPRIRPWDIGILVDDYHHMVGPIEVEQFVHTFSHETGFITEIKPAACVFGNEISSWPMVEAMKLFALAVKDFENNYTGSSMSFKQIQQDGMDTSGLFGTVVDLINSWGDKNFNTFLMDKYKEQYGDLAVNPFSKEDLQTSGLYQDTIGSGTVTDLQRNVGFGLEAGGGWLAATGLTIGLGSLMLQPGRIANIGNYVPAQSVRQVLTSVQSNVSGIVIKHPKLFLGAAIASVVAGTGLLLTANVVDKLDEQSMWLAAGSVLMLDCLRNDAIMLLPLMKNGHPIVSGLTYNNPDMMWHHLKGDLGRLAHDTITGTRDVTQLWSKYGFSLWRRGLMTEDMTGQ